MTLTPKNWGEFQHYKNRCPPWIKLHRGLLDNFEFQRLPVASRALAPMLWLLASEYEDGKITLSMEALAFRFRMTGEDLYDALNPLIESGFFTSDSTVLAPCLQDACLETEGETETEADIRSVAEATRTSVRSDFEIFWKRYPKREGSNPRKTALKAYEVARKNGFSAETLLRGLERDIARWSEAKQIATRFIPLAATWLQQARWDDHASVESNGVAIISKPVAPGSPEFDKLFEIVKPGSFQHSLMIRSKDTSQPYYPPPDLLTSIGGG